MFIVHMVKSIQKVMQLRRGEDGRATWMNLTILNKDSLSSLVVALKMQSEIKDGKIFQFIFQYMVSLLTSTIMSKNETVQYAYIFKQSDITFHL